MKELLKRLESEIKYQEESEHPDDPDERSWGYEMGVLISLNEAKLVIDLIKDK